MPAIRYPKIGVYLKSHREFDILGLRIHIAQVIQLGRLIIFSLAGRKCLA